VRYRIFAIGIIPALCSALAFWISSTVEHNRVGAIADHMLEQVNNRALQDFYELADRVRDGMATTVELPSSMAPFVSSRSLSEAWRFAIDLSDLDLKAIPSATDNATLNLNFHSDNQQFRIFLDSEAWLQALCTDLGFGDLSFSLVYRDQSVFVSGGPLPDSDVFRQDDFIFPQLSLLIDRTPVIEGMYNNRYPMSLAALTFLFILVLAEKFQRQRFRLKRSGERLRAVEAELEQTSEILRSQMEVTANNQKELLKRNYELQDINRTLEQAKHQISFSERLANLGEVSAGIVHEINNPIAYIGSNLRELESDVNALRGFINTLDKASDGLDVHSEFYKTLLAAYQELNVQDAIQQAPERLEDCIHGIERVRKIVQDMKRLSSRGNNEMTLCNLNDDISSVINIVKSRIKGDVELRTNLVELPDLVCNASQISQVLTNIFVNAIQALEGRRGLITFTERVQGNSIVLDVCDDGPGMSEEIAARVFEPFFTTKDLGSGTGMGLSLCYKLIDEHNGWIELKTTPGAGSCFSIHLPLDATQENSNVQ